MRFATEKRVMVSFILLVANVIILALMVRLPFISFKSRDYVWFLSPWYNVIVENGNYAALKYDFSNHLVYTYLTATAATFFPYYKLLSIKIIVIVFDFILAFFVYKCVRLKYNKSVMIPIMAALATLLAPTVVLNSAMWAQPDAMYTAFMIACLYALLINRQLWAFIAFGLSLSIKIQAIFLAPLFLWLLIKKELNWRYFFLSPLIYFVSLLPAWLIGRPLDDLLLYNVREYQSWVEQTYRIPNLYQWASDFNYELYNWGIMIAIIVVLIGAMMVHKLSLEMDREDLIIYLAALSVIMVPFFLPRMHDRYFFPADIITIILVFYRPRYWYVAILISLMSLNTYIAYLFEVVIIPLRYLVVIPLGVIAVLWWRLLPLQLGRRRVSSDKALS